MYTYTSHIRQTAAKARKKVNVLKALAGTDWGQDKDTILNTYKATTHSILEYGAPVWAPLQYGSPRPPAQGVENNSI